MAAAITMFRFKGEAGIEIGIEEKYGSEKPMAILRQRFR